MNFSKNDYPGHSGVWNCSDDGMVENASSGCETAARIKIKLRASFQLENAIFYFQS